MSGFDFKRVVRCGVPVHIPRSQSSYICLCWEGVNVYIQAGNRDGLNRVDVVEEQAQGIVQLVYVRLAVLFGGQRQVGRIDVCEQTH